MDKLLKKSNKSTKIVQTFYNKLTLLTNHLNNMHHLKFYDNYFYNDRMNNLSEINVKINKFESFTQKKRGNKTVIQNLLKDINDSIDKIFIKIGNNNCTSIINNFFESDIMNNLKSESKEFLEIIENYFTPLSCNIIAYNDKQNFLKRIEKENSDEQIIIHTLIDMTRNKNLIEKIEGVSVIFNFSKIDKILYVNGFFQKDSLNICKLSDNLKIKTNLIKESIEYLEIPIDFKEKYLEQLNLKDFFILEPVEIAELFKKDYNDFIDYKNKPLSTLIKEFTKSNLEKQRKIIILFLISDQESQFTAHIIFDLISDQLFLSESNQALSELIYNSLHWKIQKLFKISNTNYENSKKKIQNLSISDVSYESRILTLNASENIKAKAMEKIKEINGSKENSIKAQQWLDGFLKIPFGIYKKEAIIEFFKKFQSKLEQYINIFTIKLSEVEVDKLNKINIDIFNIITPIVDEFHSIIFKSENSYNKFLEYLNDVKTSIKNKMLISELPEDDKLLSLHDNIINNLIDKNISPSSDVIEDVIKQLENFKKIKTDLIENKILNENTYNSMIKKLNDLENMLGLNTLAKNDENEEDSVNLNSEDYNIFFTKFIIKNLFEMSNYIKEWDDFKEKKKNYMFDVDKILDKCVYGQLDAKKQMKRIIGQWMNGASKGQCFGLCGPPGVGKTTLCKNGLAKCLFDENGNSRPFAFLPLGGATNGSFLEGHHYTYLGSTWGKIVDILIETKCMNPIIYIDELDKISKTEHGKEIASILTHITDQSQNKEFYDKYFTSIPFDLSQILFIFSYNDKNNIDRILRDRIQEINIKPLTRSEKLIISKNYLCPEIYSSVGYAPDEIIIDKDALSVLVDEYTYEAGVRKLNEIIYDIVREMNLNKIMNISDVYPIHITREYIKKFMEDKSRIRKKLIHHEPRVGLVNGLFATGEGMGGITIIQVMKTYSEKKLAIEKVTGSMGDVMKDSVNLALTMAWNILPLAMKEKINTSKEMMGLHIHCPDLSTSKDGPSASLAFCLAFISRLANIPVKNTVALTGEMDLLGNAMEIGGLESKLMGAINAGVETVLIPKENEDDLDIIMRKDKGDKELLMRNSSFKSLDTVSFDENDKKRIFRGQLNVYIVENIYDVLEHALVSPIPRGDFESL